MHNYGNPISTMESSIYDAINIFQTGDIGSFNIYQFPQTWGSTALGFGGMGGQAISTAYTTVIVKHLTALVFFNGRFAYKVETINHVFNDHLNKRNMSAVGKQHYYEKNLNNNENDEKN